MTDEFTHKSLVLEAGRSFKSERVYQVLKALFAPIGKPVALRMYNGPKFVVLALKLCHRHDVCGAYIEPGNTRKRVPEQNGFAESFVSRFRDEFLDEEVFLWVLYVQGRIGAWCRSSNKKVDVPKRYITGLSRRSY